MQDMTLSEYLELNFLSEKGSKSLYYRVCRKLNIEPPKNQYGHLIVTPEIDQEIKKALKKRQAIKDFYTFPDPMPDCFKDLKDDDSDIGTD